MIKILFMIHDLGQGGAEKVLVNLVNNMNKDKFSVTVMALFGGGVNEQFLDKDIRYYTVFQRPFPGNSHIMKLFSPYFLHKMLVKEEYDIEVSYLEGPSARIISGCRNEKTKLISWIHTKIHGLNELSVSFRNRVEAVKSYKRFDRIAFVSQDVKTSFCKLVDVNENGHVLYNTIESEKIKELSMQKVPDSFLDEQCTRIIAMGTLKEIKGYERLLHIAKRLKEKYSFHLYILGIGPLKETFESYIRNNGLENCVTLLGYHVNPYKYLKNSDLFVCSSYEEGFSTATTEALIIGTPVCTVDVSGMKEMLGTQNEYGLITANDEESLYLGIEKFLKDPDLLLSYKEKAIERGKKFSTFKTVKEVEDMFSRVVEDYE